MKNDRMFQYGMSGVVLLGFALIAFGLILDESRFISRWVLIIAGPIVIATAIICYIFLKDRSTHVTLEGGNLRIKGVLVDKEINVSDIQSICMRDDVGYISYGIRTMGYGGIRILGGTYTNKEFGVYTVSVDTRDRSCIVLLHDDKHIVFNLGDQLETQMMFNRISKECKNLKG